MSESDPTARQAPAGQQPTAAPEHLGVSEQLLALFDGHRLSPAQRRIAQYLLDHQPDAAFLSSVALAERVGVSQPSVTRFATALGFAGYPELRDALRPIVLSSPDPARAESPTEVRRNEYQAAIDAERDNLAALRRIAADPARVIALGADLADSTPLTVLGTRVSAALASYFGYAAARIHPDVRLVTRGGSAALDAIAQAREAGGSWLLAFVMPRYAVEAVAALRAARALGLRVAVITDVPLVPFADSADVLLPTAVGSQLVFDSYAAPMTLAALLLQAMADAEPARTQARLEAYESLAEQNRFYES
jgi:DNA-binding MurR/RpiR family transcriptional regulator